MQNYKSFKNVSHRMHFKNENKSSQLKTNFYSFFLTLFYPGLYIGLKIIEYVK